MTPCAPAIDAMVTAIDAMAHDALISVTVVLPLRAITSRGLTIQRQIQNLSQNLKLKLLTQELSIVMMPQAVRQSTPSISNHVSCVMSNFIQVETFSMVLFGPVWVVVLVLCLLKSACSHLGLDCGGPRRGWSTNLAATPFASSTPIAPRIAPGRIRTIACGMRLSRW
jgi:hypothetical protein